jgi:hypothetical protein
MARRTTTSGRAARRTRRPPAAGRRPGLLLGAAAAGAVLVNVLAGADPAAQAEAEPMSVADQLGLAAGSTAASGRPDLQPLEELAASRNSREAEQTAAQQAQAAADQVELDRRQAEAAAVQAAAVQAAAVQAAAEAAATAAAAESAAAAVQEEAADAPAAAAAAGAVSAVARISNSAGAVAPQVQAAANMVVSHVPGAAGITLGGTRPSATDPGGHPSGLALDYMVGVGSPTGDAIVAYHIAHWDELGVEYVIWEQRMLSSPGGSWRSMEDRGSSTANHYDHVHVNYRG